ncbi:SoxR reducing system RseC family protein [Xylanibacter muris]|uniref:SoxR reducing system RseC family protein n=1 Tax=Xylanibacter muris TaxID=2736290 RepID=A0ABX2ARR3_9BACT|nr:SoxR reducing system RseC family protein [Xylanibacter muris]NPD92722.1 SoxR reducing system RseC family protein [Xylanibacter muris]
MKNKEYRISHSGVVAAVDGDCVSVRIVQTSACASCKLSGHCNASEKKIKIIDAHNRDAGSFKVGEKVVVGASVNIFRHSVFLAFVLPLIIMALTGFVVARLYNDWDLGVLVSPIGLILYYILLYFLRDRLKRELVFTVEHSDNY